MHRCLHGSYSYQYASVHVMYDMFFLPACCCRPVKVIRLVGRYSVEEIILKRAHSKLKLTNTVIEGGQVGVCVCSYGYTQFIVHAVHVEQDV